MSSARAHDEANIFAESAHEGERAVGWLRIVTWVVLGIAFSLAEGGHGPETEHGDSVLHVGLIGGWLVFAVAVVLVLRKVKFTPARALWWPIGFMLVDNGVFNALALSTHDAPRPGVTIATLAILVTFSAARFTSLHVWLSALLAIAGTVTQARFQQWNDPSSVLVADAAYLCLAVVMRWVNRRIRVMFVDVRRRENLARFLAPQVVERVLAAGGRPLEPVEREVTILFSDIRDFTTLSQKMDPASVLKMLDEYFGHMSEIVKGNGGMVNKFLGDGMLAVWGAPDPLDDHAPRAVKAALEMKKRVAELNALPGRQTLRIGIGLHTGTVAAGMLGGPDQHEYTVIGDAVNVASRVEGLCKKVGADLVVSEATWSRCGGRFQGERVGAEPVKGRDEPVVVYRVDG